jgi:K+-sensing histidine kinase KdpD
MTDNLESSPQSDADRKLKMLMHALSHDLKTPVRGLSGLLDLFFDPHTTQEDQKRYQDLIRKSLTRLHEMIEGLAEYSNISLNKDPPEQIKFSELFKKIQNQYDQYKISITQEDSTHFIGHKKDVHKAFCNIIDNCIKFKQQDHPLEIQILIQQSKDKILVIIQDNGIGIPEKDEASVFLIFQKLHSPEEYPGTGLGLAFCKEVFRCHGGDIEILPPPPQGTAFRITLPVYPD